MSEVDETANGGDQANGQDQNEQVKDPGAVLKKNRELLAKLKAEQEKAKAAHEKLEQLEQEQLAHAGKKDELIESLKKQVREKDEKLKGVTQTFALKSVNSQVIDAARAMGCEKPEVIMRLADLSDVTVQDDFTVDQTALKAALDKVKSDLPELFKKTPAAPRDGVPSNQVDKPKPLGQMSIKELQELYTKKALSQ